MTRNDRRAEAAYKYYTTGSFALQQTPDLKLFPETVDERFGGGMTSCAGVGRADEGLQANLCKNRAGS